MLLEFHCLKLTNASQKRPFIKIHFFYFFLSSRVCAKSVRGRPSASGQQGRGNLCNDAKVNISTSSSQLARRLSTIICTILIQVRCGTKGQTFLVVFSAAGKRAIHIWTVASPEQLSPATDHVNTHPTQNISMSRCDDVAVPPSGLKPSRELHR